MDRTKRLSVRITDEEYLILKELANNHSTSISNFVRNKLLFEGNENDFAEETKINFTENNYDDLIDEMKREVNNLINENQEKFLGKITEDIVQRINWSEDIPSTTNEFENGFNQEENELELEKLRQENLEQEKIIRDFLRGWKGKNYYDFEVGLEVSKKIEDRRKLNV